MSSSISEESLSSSISLNHIIKRSQYNIEHDNMEFDYRMADTLSFVILNEWSSSTDCDLVLVVSNQRYYVHSFILLNVCHSLENLLISNNSSTIKYVCQLTITSCCGLELLLIYIYTSRIILSVNTISDLFIAASELDVEHIIQRCIHFINASIRKMYDKTEEPTLLWSYIKCCLLIPKNDNAFYEEIIQAIKYFYPNIISSSRFLSLTPNVMIRIFDLLFPNNISSSILYNSLLDWAQYSTDQSNRQSIMEYLIMKYLNNSNFSNNNSNSITNKFMNMEKKLHALLDYQENILHRLDDSKVQIDSNDSLEQLPKSSNEQTLWITESEETINMNKAHSCTWNFHDKNITNIIVCCTLGRDRREINKDIRTALHKFNQFDLSEQKYTLIHVGNYIYALREYKTQMFKYNIISQKVHHIDGPYPSRSQYGLAATIDYIIIIGGLATENKSISSSIFFDFKQEQWYSLPKVPLKYEQGVFLPGLCFLDHNTIVVVGGLIMTSEGPIAMRKCFRLNLKKRKWLSITSCNEARGQAMVTYCSDMIYTIGGLQYIYDKYKFMTTINVISIEEYNIHTDQWTVITRLQQLDCQKRLYCTSDAILIGTDKKNQQWSYDLPKQHLICNFEYSKCRKNSFKRKLKY